MRVVGTYPVTSYARYGACTNIDPLLEADSSGLDGKAAYVLLEFYLQTCLGQVGGHLDALVVQDRNKLCRDQAGNGTDLGLQRAAAVIKRPKSVPGRKWDRNFAHGLLSAAPMQVNMGKGMSVRG